MPSGIWDESEYTKLPAYDRGMGFQPTGVFLCHQQDGRMCAGWVATHDMRHSLALRFAVAMGQIDENDVDAIIDYTTTVPVFGSGLEAAAHGLKEVERPSLEAIEQIERLQAKAKRRPK